ncbi:uncharacterized protein [Anabrus simplex]|uniref:uncharacterized protein n=1 Tax=Anabrus simplex TaxID=316456 RepID=UPI0034DD6E69
MERSDRNPWLDSDRESKGRSVLTTFEDNFEPIDRLPDSAEYLATLEQKLAKLKERQSKKDLVQSLEETHKSCMLRLLAEGTPFCRNQEDFELDTPVANSHALLRHIAPEKQALTLGELVELLKADQLSEKLAEEELPEEQ